MFALHSWIASFLSPYPLATSGDPPFDGFDELGIVEARIFGPLEAGRVRFQATIWPARCLQAIAIHPGQTVRILYKRGIDLWVEPYIWQPLESGRLEPERVGDWLNTRC